MFIEQPPLLYRLLFPEAIWRLPKKNRKVAYLTFDDGPIPEVTPWVLDLLKEKQVKATFFLVGENVKQNPELLERIKAEGHSFGNHTMHHRMGHRTPFRDYMKDVGEADELIGSILFRPPHGLMRWKQSRAVKEHYNVIMYDVVTRDYDRYLLPSRIIDNVKRYTRNGSIIVFHDSIKAEKNMRTALPVCIDWLLSEGYELLPIRM